MPLLWIDAYVHGLLATYPGVPAGTRFSSLAYRWNMPRKMAALRTEIAACGDAATRWAQGAPIDQTVMAYAQTFATHMPAVLELAAYYEDRHFIDDEFDRGRREQVLVTRATAELAKLRPRLWSTVLEAWREAAPAAADSPRALVTRAWEACMKVGEVMITDGTASQLDRAVSACRRGIPSVVALPADTRGTYDATLRHTAAKLGNRAAGSRSSDVYEIPAELREITDAYLALWPDLPTTPAERVDADATVHAR